MVALPMTSDALVERLRHECASSGKHDHDGCSCSDAELLHSALKAVGTECALAKSRLATAEKERDKWRDWSQKLAANAEQIVEAAEAMLRKAVAAYYHGTYSGKDSSFEGSVEAVIRAIATVLAAENDTQKKG